MAEKVQMKIEKSKINAHLEILDEREQEVIRGRFSLHGPIGTDKEENETKLIDNLRTDEDFVTENVQKMIN